ncbi:hypothetical protein B5722_04095 [Escherichia coli]|uniref:Uncharacterized protein n=1 Tax=Escherichia coli TaxID=562 RepID=A0A346GM99_ECOLX|nr:hypothetical protein CWB37_17265 [Escherichia coli]AUA47915.1 hypothetical protein CWO47_23800 [Escherichia coli]AXO08395.1 hypothetical protein DS732_19640 [Escherichia coli]EEW4966891.1 hypothetical protein [Escherichia coli]EEY5521275.1 hypothetical protein [Escherichia coli]
MTVHRLFTTVHPLMDFLCCLLLFVFINSPGMNKKKQFVFHYKKLQVLQNPLRPFQSGWIKNTQPL